MNLCISCAGNKMNLSTLMYLMVVFLDVDIDIDINIFVTISRVTVRES